MTTTTLANKKYGRTREKINVTPLYPSVSASAWEANISAVAHSPSMNGRSVAFPKRLLNMIRKEAILSPDVVRWSQDGRAFFVDDEAKFISTSLPRYGFKASKMQSFQRNLNIYGFTRLSKGPYMSGYVHPDFGRDIQESQLGWILRENVKKDGGNKRNRSDLQPSRSSSSFVSTDEDDDGSTLENDLQKLSKKNIVSTESGPASEKLDFSSPHETNIERCNFELQDLLFRQEELQSHQVQEGIQDNCKNMSQELQFKNKKQLRFEEKMKNIEDKNPQKETLIKASNFWSLPHMSSSEIELSSSSSLASTLSLFSDDINDDDDENGDGDNTKNINNHDHSHDDDEMMSSNCFMNQFSIPQTSNKQEEQGYNRKSRMIHTTISTVRAPQDLKFDNFMDRLYVKKCAPEFSC